jgi:Leucine-rich repeat (LRR) protein
MFSHSSLAHSCSRIDPCACNHEKNYVICNNASITQIHVERVNLTGTIPSNIGVLSRLVYLALAFNRITGSLPSEISSLAKLTHLNLGANRISGSIPPELSKLQSLNLLWLDNNTLTGPIPSTLIEMPNLAGLLLYNNRLSGKLPALPFRNYTNQLGCGINDCDPITAPGCNEGNRFQCGDWPSTCEGDPVLHTCPACSCHSPPACPPRPPTCH